MKKKVVMADSGISAPQMMDFWRKVGDGTIDGEIFQSFLANPRRFISDKFTTLARAINILSQVRVITAEQAAQKWGMEAPKNAAIRYSEETLRECAAQNKVGADWRLIYCCGLSLRQQCDKIGLNRDKQPCFDPDYNWWQKKSEDKWANINPQPGYYLINLCSQFGNMTWNQQEEEIAKLGKEYERCHEAVFGEAVLTIYMVTGKRIAEDWWHWGSSASSFDYHVNVGYFYSDGLGVRYYWYDYCLHYLRVCVARKFDH